MMIALIAAISDEREQRAIEYLFEQYFPHAKRMAMGILHNEQDAEDAAMNAIAYMCHHSEDIVDYPYNKAASLFFMRVKCESIDMYRRNKRRNRHEAYFDSDDSPLEQIPDGDPSIEEIVVSRENREILMRAIAQLNDIYRIPILLRYNYQMKNTEIAEFVHADVNTVNGRFFRGKKQLEKILMEMGYNTHE